MSKEIFAVESAGTGEITMVKVESADVIGEIATRYPESIPCFERWHLDFSSRGDRSLAEACAEEGIELESLVAELRQSDPESAPEIDWSSRPMTELTRHLVERYHDPSRSRLAVMESLAERIVASRDRGAESFVRLQRLLRALRDDLFPHMLKEETTLFPWVERLTDAKPGEEIERPFFGTIRNPMNMMSLEHGYVVEILDELRRVTNGYVVPDGEDETVSELYGLLRDFDREQKLHVHLENNVLFPRVIEMEDRVRIVDGGAER